MTLLGPFNTVIDLWLEEDHVELGGVTMTRFGKVSHDGRTVDEVYAEICQKLKGKV